MTRLIKLAPTRQILPGESRADLRTIGRIRAIVHGIAAHALRRIPVYAHVIGIAPARGATDIHGFGSGLPGTISAALNTTRHRDLLVCIFLMHDGLMPIDLQTYCCTQKDPEYGEKPLGAPCL
jgi:hypothetical protein